MARFFISSVRLTVDRLPDMQEVGGSNPLLRTTFPVSVLASQRIIRNDTARIP